MEREIPFSSNDEFAGDSPLANKSIHLSTNYGVRSGTIKFYEKATDHYIDVSYSCLVVHQSKDFFGH